MPSGGLYKIFGFVCLWVVAAAGASAADKTLDSLLDLALQRNPDLKVAQFAHQSLQVRAEAVGRLPDPQLSAGFMNLPRRSLALDESPMTGIALGLTQSVPWPGKLRAEEHQAAAQADIGANAALLARSRLIRMVSDAYYDYSYWRLSEDVLRKNLQLTDGLLEVVQTRYVHGIASAQDVLRTQTVRSRLENRIIQAEQQARSALIRIGELLDDGAVAGNELAVWLPFPAEVITDPDTALVDTTNLWLRGASLEVEAAERDLSLVHAGYWPDLMIGLEYRLREDHPMDPVGGEDFISAKVGVTLPVWSFGRQRDRKRAAKATLRAAEAKEHAVRRRVESRRQDLSQQLAAKMESIDRYDRSILPQAKAAYEAAGVAYEVGQIDFNALLSAQTDLLDVELERLQLLRHYHLNLIQFRELLSTDQGA